MRTQQSNAYARTDQVMVKTPFYVVPVYIMKEDARVGLV
jgi:hypothetical protein